MDSQQIADLYYETFRSRGDFADVPMADDLCFRSPMMKLDGATPFRQALSGLLGRFQSLEIRHQLANEGSVVTVYDFDMGAPSGPIPMAEVIEVAGGEITGVELLFDPAPLAPPAG